MNLEVFKQHLEKLETLGFELPNGSFVPPYFHVTEVGKVNKLFIDCGGIQRTEAVVNFQLWSSTDYDHRLHPEKLADIISLAQEKFDIGDLLIEVEYQGQTIEKYGLAFNGNHFRLTQRQTDCLAKDNCGIPVAKTKTSMSALQNNSCAPGAGCC